MKRSYKSEQYSHLLLLFILLLAALSYSNTIYSPPVLDDGTTFINNPSVYIESLSFDALKQVHSGQFGRTRFIPMLSFAVDQLLGQGNIIQFHLTNIAIHLLAAIAVYILVRGLASTETGQRYLFLLTPSLFSISVTALWTLHPVQTNTVTYLVQRMASFAALFYSTSLAGYVWARISRTATIRTFCWSIFILSMCCSLLSKENSATLPLAALLIELTFISPDLAGRLAKKIKWYHWFGLGMIFILLFPLIMTKINHFAETYAAQGRHFTILERLFTEMRVLVFYLSLLLLPLPARLNLDHDFPVSHSLSAPAGTWLSLILLIILLFTAVRRLRTNPFLSFGILFFFLNLVIESSIIPLELVFEHRLYLPSIGFFLAFVTAIDLGSRYIPAPNKKERQKILLLGMVILSCSLGIFTTFRNNIWQDKLTIYQDIARKSPLKPRALTNLGKALAENGRYEEALEVLRSAISTGSGENEEYIKAANSIVIIYLSQGKYEEAAREAEELIKNRPAARLNFDGFPRLMASLGMAYWKLDQFSKSLEAFQLGLKIRHPEHTSFILGGMEALLLDASKSQTGRQQLGIDESEESAYTLLASVLLSEQDYKNAGTFLAKALAINPEYETALAIKEIYDEENSKNKQVSEYINEIKLEDEHRGRIFKLSLWAVDFIENKYTLLNHLILPILKKTVQLEPDSPVAAIKLARLYLQKGNIEDALKLAEVHLAKFPEHPALLEIAAKCYYETGDNKAAAENLYKLLDVYPGHPERKRYAKFVMTYYGS